MMLIIIAIIFLMTGQQQMIAADLEQNIFTLSDDDLLSEIEILDNEVSDDDRQNQIKKSSSDLQIWINQIGLTLLNCYVYVHDYSVRSWRCTKRLIHSILYGTPTCAEKNELKT